MRVVKMMARISKKQIKDEMIQQTIYHVGIYARLSVDNHNEKNESIETQIDIAKLYIKDKPEFEFYHSYIDLGKSGVNFERNGFKQLMEDIRQAKVNCVIVKDFSRLGRNYIETGNFIQKIFPFLGVRFISVTDGFDSNHVQTEDFCVNLKNLVNELYAADIAAKVKSTRKSQQKKGSYTGGYAPYGYNLCKIDGKRVLAVNEEEANIVRALFNQYEAGVNCKGLIRWLYQNNIHRPTEYRKYKHIYSKEGEVLLEWSKWTVKSILTNPVYIGCLIYGTVCKENSLLKSYQNSSFTEYSIKENTHQAIISQEQFFKIARQFEEQSLHYSNKKKDTQSVLLEEDIFDGILFCGDCNCKIKRTALIKNVNPSKKIRKYIYHCPYADRIDVKKCHNHRILLEQLQELVTESLKKQFLFSNINRQDMMEYIKSQLELKQALLCKNSDILKKKIQTCKKRKSEQYLKYQSGRMGLHVFKKVQQENRQQVTLLSKKLEEIKNQQKENDMILAKQDMIVNSLLKRDTAIELEKEFLHTLIKKIYIFSDKRVEITFCFQEPNRINKI